MNFTSAMVPASPTSPTVSEKKVPHTQKDTTYTKIFVGGLPFHTTDQSLRKFFEPYGEIEEAVVITDRNSGRSKGYGFVSIILLVLLSLNFKSLNFVGFVLHHLN